MDGILPLNTSLGSLRIHEIYKYYDFPILFSCQNELSHLYLAFRTWEEGAYNNWYYLPVSPERLYTIKSGNIELANAFLQSEINNIFYVKTHTTSDAWDTIELTAVENIIPALLPPSTYKLRCVEESEPIFTPAHLLDLTKKYAINILSLRIKGKTSLEERWVKFVAGIIDGIQSLLNTIAISTEANAYSEKWKIPQAITSNTQLQLLGTYYGSLWINLGIHSNGQLFNTLADKSVDILYKILDPELPEDEVKKILGGLKNRPVSKLKEVLKVLYKNEATLGVSRANPTQSKAEEIRHLAVQPERARKVFDIITTIDSEDEEIVEIKGVLKWMELANEQKATFIIYDETNEEYFEGLIVPEAVHSDTVHSAELHRKYIAQIKKVSERSELGAIKIKYYLQDLSYESH